MKIPTLRKSLALLLAVAGLLATAAGAQADTMLTLKSHQDAFEIQGTSQPAQDSTVTVWLRDGAVVRQDDQSAVLLTADKLYLINHQDKSYNALDLPVDLTKLLPPEMAAQVKQMREQAGIQAEVEATEETRKIGDWDARRYDLTLSNPMGLKVDQVIWASTDVGVDPAAYHALAGALAALQPGGGEWISEMDAVKGFPVLRETTMSLGPETRVTTTEELVSVETKDAPAGTFAPPADYQEKPFNPGAGGPPAS